MSAVAVAVQHVVARLRASGGVGAPIVQGVSSEGVSGPLVLVQTYTEAQDVNYNGGHRAATQVVLLVRAVAPGDDLSVVVDLARAVDARLHGSAAAYPGGLVSSCLREQESELAEVDSGQTVRYLGGRYRIHVNPV